MMRAYCPSADALLWSCILSAILLTLPAASAQDATIPRHTFSAADLNRGRALYGASCETCHTQNIHWRDKGRVSSWDTLVNEVTRWQRNSGHSWKQAEINDVAAYLNDRFYRLPCPPDACAEKQAAK